MAVNTTDDLALRASRGILIADTKSRAAAASRSPRSW